MGAAWASPLTNNLKRLMASNDPKNLVNTKVWSPSPTPHIKDFPSTVLEASCLEKSLFQPSCQWPSRTRTDLYRTELCRCVLLRIDFPGRNY